MKSSTHERRLRQERERERARACVIERPEGGKTAADSPKTVKVKAKQRGKQEHCLHTA